MRINSRATRVMLAASLVFGPAAATVLTAGSAHAATTIPWVCETTLPSQAITTIDLIAAGGPYPFSKDGEVFYNNEALLPTESTGYYHAYTVITPGVSTRGARRIVTAEDGEEYYTADHYASFSDVDFTC